MLSTRNEGRAAWLVVALALAIGVAGLLTLHTIRHAIRMHRATEQVRPWMSIPYIAHSHHVPAPQLYEAIGLPFDRHDHRPLWRIARQENRPVDQLIASVEAVIAHVRGNAPPALEPGSVP
ncbi:MAG: hypothetical protein ABSH09_30340 [Bryobacteraceae bacterium]